MHHLFYCCNWLRADVKTWWLHLPWWQFRFDLLAAVRSHLLIKFNLRMTCYSKIGFELALEQFGSPISPNFQLCSTLWSKVGIHHAYKHVRSTTAASQKAVEAKTGLQTLKMAKCTIGKCHFQRRVSECVPRFGVKRSFAASAAGFRDPSLL